MKLFELNYKIYTSTKNNPEEFIVDLDEVYKWVGFSRKDNAKTLLESKNADKKNLFEINKDYIIKKVFLAKQENLDGRPSNKILLTIKCFKKYCLKASTQQSDKIYDYYIKMEEIITKYIENKQLEMIDNNKNILQLKDLEIENNKKKILVLKDQEILNKNKLLEEILSNL